VRKNIYISYLTCLYLYVVVVVVVVFSIIIDYSLNSILVPHTGYEFHVFSHDSKNYSLGLIFILYI
jgi:hypothetical protein